MASMDEQILREPRKSLLSSLKAEGSHRPVFRKILKTFIVL
jgi:hypothetical protein